MSILKPEETHHQCIMDIPTEILSEIFMQCLADWRRPLANPRGFNSGEAPLLLTKVCRLWRTVSLSTQRLWTVLPCLDKSHISPESGTDKLFRMYLSHSGSAPLSIHIHTQSSSQGDYRAALLSPHIHRAGQLHITHTRAFNESSNRSLNRLVADHRGMFKLLTYLEITSDELQPMLELSSLNAFEDAPLLKSVFLVGPPRMVNLPWSQIKYYCRHIPDIEDVSDILLPYTQLEALELCITRSYRGGTLATIFLPQLQKMRLTGAGGTSHPLLASLHTPLLEVIQINDFTYPSPIPSALIACIYCTRLTSLQLLCPHVGVDELLQLSRLIPGLRELDMLLTLDALRELVFSPTENNIFPRLARLTIRDPLIDNRELIELCQSRCSLDPDGAEGGSRVEPLQFCEIYTGPGGGFWGSRGMAQQLQDVAESFQDDLGFQDVIDRLERLLLPIRAKRNPFDRPKASFMDLDGLVDCFNFLETYEISDPLLLERYNFIMLMNHFVQGSPDIVIPPHIQMSASALLAKWGPLWGEYNAGDTRWRVREVGGWYKLVYSPNIGGRFQSKFM